MPEAPAIRIPTATYRLQFNSQFTFARAQELVPYFHALGISDCYASSFLRAMPGSTHGYDVIDPTRLNDEIGSEADFTAMTQAIRAHSMGLILDVVPNHMGIGKVLNSWWRDVLENGPSSHYSDAFDIDWHPIKRELENKVLLPILGDQYGTVLENQEIQIRFIDGAFLVEYGDQTLPLAPKSWLHLLSHDLDRLTKPDDPDVIELHSIITALRHLPSQHERDPDRVSERYREKEVIKRRLAALVEHADDIRRFITENAQHFNGEKGKPDTFDLLDRVLNGQSYRLASWKVASEEVNYRRFFDINDLAAIRMEEPRVFQEVHGLVFELLRKRAVTGLRIDHVDGLYDPGLYLKELQSWAIRELDSGLDDQSRPLFIVVEKILGDKEPLPQDWPVYGTTGYEFLVLVNGLFVDQRHERLFTEFYQRFTGRRMSYDDLVYESKNLIMRMSMASEINVLGHGLNLLSERDRRSRDFTLNNLTDALREIIACFPVYRTYMTGGMEPPLERDRAYIYAAVACAKRRNPELSVQVFDFIRSILLKQADVRTEQDRMDQMRFVLKFQQVTGPVMAKGVEDTVFYVYNRLISLNEVGGSPARFGLSLADFHASMRERQEQWPCSLSASSTHDTKRSEDVRARLNLLSEFPGQWRELVGRWSRWNKKFRSDVEGESAPDRNDEYLLYQTLIGAWPLEDMDEHEYAVFVERILAYMKKAIYEAKVRTSWINPHQGYDEAVHRFVSRVLDRKENSAFLNDFLPFQRQIAGYGLFNSLSQLLVKIAAPGVPDIYQGTELWDFSLVDPDNRRPVDYQLRGRILNELRAASDEAGADRRAMVAQLLRHRADGRIKLYITMVGLQYRRANPRVFAEGRYLALDVQGVRRGHVCAFARVHGDRTVVAVVPRLLGGLMSERNVPAPVGTEVWEDTRIILPGNASEVAYRSLFTGSLIRPETDGGCSTLAISRVLEDCPIALLELVRS